MTTNKNKTKNKNGKLGIIRRFLKKSLKYFVLATFSAVLISVFDLLTPKIISFTIDSVLGSKPSVYDGTPVDAVIGLFGGVEGLRANLWIIALTVLTVSVIAVVFRYLFRLFNSKGAETLVLNMRRQLFSHIERLPFEWHTENQTGDIIQRCTSDVETVKRFLSEQLTSVIRIIILITLSLIFMFNMNVTLSFIALASIPVIVTYSLIFHRKISKRFGECDVQEGILSAITQENLTGVRVVRAFGREDFERERFRKQSGYYANLWIKLSRLFSLFWAMGDLISGIQVMLIVIIGVNMCVNHGMTTGDFVAFISYNAMLVWPVRQLGRMISQMSQAGISLERIAYIVNSETEKDKEGARESDMKGDIVFDNVSFSYKNGTRVLDSVSFEIKEGTTFGILGSTGSGKSTLMYLLDRLYELPEENGKITVGGVDIADMKAADVRRGIGMVMQEPFLFSKTLAENIGIACEEYTEDEVREAAKTACLDETVEGFADKYETTVGERGVTLSGGQKQRTAIARMLMRKTPIMIFDDSLSAVDAETDAKIRHALKSNTGKSTVILISHRTTSLMRADKIIVLDRGRVVQSGTHSELISRDGLYKSIYDIQTRAEEVSVQ